jgi:hypothetical protein
LREESGLAYFDALVSLYRTIPEPVDSPAKQEVVRLIKKHDADISSLTRSDIHSLDISLLQIMPLAHVKQRRAQLSDSYKELAGDHLFDLYEKSLPNHGTASYQETEEDIRNDSRFLLSEVQRLRIGYSQFERLRTKVKVCVVSLLGVVVVVLVVMGVSAYYEKSTIPPIAWAAAAGAMGAMFSLLHRVGEAQASSQVASQLNILEAVKKRMVWAPFLSTLEGVVAASILHFILISGLVAGELFPEYDKESREAKLSLVATTQPATEGTRGAGGNLSTGDKTVRGVNTDASLKNSGQSIPTGSADQGTAPKPADGSKPENAAGKGPGTNGKPDDAGKGDPSTEANAGTKGDAGPKGTPIRVLLFYLPVSVAALAKVLVWSFIAGFAERFVPDVLDQVKEAGASAARRPAQERPTDRITTTNSPRDGGAAAAGAGAAGAAGGAGAADGAGAAGGAGAADGAGAGKSASPAGAVLGKWLAMPPEPPDPIKLSKGSSLIITLLPPDGAPKEAANALMISALPVNGGVTVTGAAQPSGEYQIELAATASAAVGPTGELVVKTPTAAGDEAVWSRKVEVV